MPENTRESVVDDGVTDVVVHPLSGELLALRGMPTTDVARTLKAFDGEVLRLADFRKALVDELVARLDRGNERKAKVGDYVLETNAPTEVDYHLDVLAEGLDALVKDDKLEAEVLERVITWTKPAEPTRRIDKREVNKLLRSDDPAIVAAIVKSRATKNVNRTLKVDEVASR